ncbi:MAG TPA: hypothetical protein VMY34_11210, partial [Acidimicrobiales bacterium]|nr:hypothetical protein [Acidimicrobiales bacterium]
NADGSKMGKTAAGAVWLDSKRTSPYAFYQVLVRTSDADVGRYLRGLTFLERGRIEELDAVTASAPERREGQRALAWEVTSLVHGEFEADKARHAAEVLFTEAIAGLDEATLLEVFAEAPSSTQPRSVLEGEGWSLVDALADAGLYPSKGQARKALEGGGASVNNVKVADATRALTRDDLLHDRYIVLRKGKRDHHLLRLE